MTKSVQVSGVLSFIDRILEEQVFHSEEDQTGHQAVTARLMLRTDPFYLQAQTVFKLSIPEYN